MNSCDCCHRSDREVDNYLMDDNAEVTLCRPCFKRVLHEVDTLTKMED